jgi:hypothetical protein
MKRRSLCAVLALVAFIVVPNAGVEGDIQQILSETQKLQQSNGGFRIVWWIPTDYWRESFKKTNLSQAQSDAFCKSLDDYIIFAVDDAKVGPMGGITPVPRDQLLPLLSASIGTSKDMKPLDPSQLSPDAKNFLDMMKPAMANMLGQFGSGLEFFCFPAKDANGARLIDPRKEGMLKLTYGSNDYKFRLPLGSLLPPKFDPQTGEQFLGNYIYSPFTGAKLVDTPPAKTP